MIERALNQITLDEIEALVTFQRSERRTTGPAAEPVALLEQEPSDCAAIRGAVRAFRQGSGLELGSIGLIVNLRAGAPPTCKRHRRHSLLERLSPHV
ncbi:hypothetical protein EN829_032580 [Mesorhizobium sp. M00.F.Ca.ET.186.01.1.1]|nr:hypothetical protein EN848_32455 [bacterium M00.F.Ca.ET.205.01.1.1]TGU46040.1 hypothetical protein EN795_33130 [bacterium M00.F.Ca.ET.152.01.1.1]TGV31513.1 hypothetical protein EN829_032580 [Mesorhizobium sp. M00.F.Ca.ET.186.01.1.1]TGZ38717.1 hypothetical protein EN805_32400 [bacterium M00.F.Ca.ET.162.01.1.1]